MEAIELCIQGELFFFENTLSAQQITYLESYTAQYFEKNRNAIRIDDFVTAANEQFQPADL